MYEATSSGLLAPIQQWLNDPLVSEIMINQPQQVWVESQGVVICHYIEALSEYHLMTLIQLIAKIVCWKILISFVIDNIMVQILMMDLGILVLRVHYQDIEIMMVIQRNHGLVPKVC